jgi:hypothetical protein
LSNPEAAQWHAQWQFGQMIGNTEMHSGNVSLFVAGASLKKIQSRRIQPGTGL